MSAIGPKNPQNGGWEHYQNILLTKEEFIREKLRTYPQYKKEIQEVDPEFTEMEFKKLYDDYCVKAYDRYVRILTSNNDPGRAI